MAPGATRPGPGTVSGVNPAPNKPTTSPAPPDKDRYRAADALEVPAADAVAHPSLLPAHAPAPPVERGFAFVDLCGFTAFMETQGLHVGAEVLDEFRTVCKSVVSRRGVRVAKWLGDGLMLVAVDPAPLAAAVVDICGKVQALGHGVRAGVAYGPVLLFEGDDYVGRAVNLASRLADAARPGEVLLDPSAAPGLPDWVRIRGERRVRLKGVETSGKVLVLSPFGISRGR